MKENKQKKQRITWHTAFFDAIRLELINYRDVLDFDIERQLTREPLRIDMVIIKKKKEIDIGKSIAAIFRGHNLLEYKSPADSLTAADFHKVMAYANLYCALPERTDIRDLTVTFVVSREPRKLKAFLREVCRYKLTEKNPGITLIEGAVMPMQIIAQRKLPLGEAQWLANLRDGLSFERVNAMLAEAKKVPEDAPIGAYVHILAMANEQRFKEVLEMRTNRLEELLVETGTIARWEAQAEMKKAIATARIMKANNEPISKILLYTGLTEKQIAEFEEQAAEA
jgi:hypothetical protein